MTAAARSAIPGLLERYEADLLEEWVKHQLADVSRRKDLIKDGELREQSRAFLQEFRKAMQADNVTDLHRPEWAATRDVLGDIAASRAKQGFSPSETATFVFSLKQPLFSRLRTELVKSPEQLSDALWSATVILDKLGLYSMEMFQKVREEVINRQQEEMLELSTPVVQLWDGILALPLIGTLDSKRTQSVMESLLQRIVETGAEVAILDITGVPTVDTLTAQHLIKTITATRLMGAECIISGIRPQIAQTVVHLGVDLGGVVTKSTMSGALAMALQRRNLSVVKNAPRTTPRPSEAREG